MKCSRWGSLKMLKPSGEASRRTSDALFSATLPAAIRKLANRYMNNPLEISVDHRDSAPFLKQTQCFYRVRDERQLAALTRLLEIEEVKCALIFTRTKARAQELADEMNRVGYPAEFTARRPQPGPPRIGVEPLPSNRSSPAGCHRCGRPWSGY